MKELEKNELMKVEGGFLPIVAILIIDGIMLACSACALGMNQALKDSQR